jgi:hypothetical protein
MSRNRVTLDFPVEEAMRTSGVAAVALGVMSVWSPGAAGAAELTILSGVRDVAPAFERATELR